MKKIKIIPLFLILGHLTSGQNSSDAYSFYSKKADSLLNAKNFKEAAITYSKAFESIEWKGAQIHRYNAACAWALAEMPDSAFYQLNNIATKAKYTDYVHIVIDTSLYSLHQDKRWEPLIEIIKQNKDKDDSNLNQPLVAQLDSIFIADQNCRIQIDTIERKYGWESNQMKAHIQLIQQIDSVNLIKIKGILAKYGWLGSDVIGGTGNLTFFLVIQHADLTTQQKYLPMMREAVKNGKASAQNLALLEDRVALGEGRKQTYGTQIGRDKINNTYYVLPLEDPDNVDNRRSKIGLQSMTEYLSQWQIRWDVEEYKRKLPEIEAKARPK